MRDPDIDNHVRGLRRTLGNLEVYHIRQSRKPIPVLGGKGLSIGSNTVFFFPACGIVQFA
ncbi:hypothetical protein D3C72_2355830 [compost metagenome]